MSGNVAQSSGSPKYGPGSATAKSPMSLSDVQMLQNT